MLKRVPKQSKPIQLSKRAWVEAQTLTVMGIDPGFASTGVVVLEKQMGQKPSCLYAGVIRTKKAEKKDRRGLRVTADDSRRMREVWNALVYHYASFEPQVLAFEVYTPYRAQGGSAWKAARVEGAVQMFGLERGMLVLPFLPQDLKRNFCGKLSASKGEVQEAVVMKVESLDVAIQKLSKGMHEHAADAAGHAYLAFEEVYRLRAMMGF